MRIHLPAETWAEVFGWLNRREFAQKMEQLWDREFSPIAEKWLHEWSKGIKIGILEFGKDFDANQAELDKHPERRSYWADELVPIAEVEMPKNICSFEEIRISYFDNTVLAFLRRIQPLLRNVHLLIQCYGSRQDSDNMLDHLLPMFNGSEFESVKLSQSDAKSLIHDRYASALLNTKMLTIDHDISSGYLLTKWLFTRRVDGQPRMLVLAESCCQTFRANYQEFIELVQERFANTTEVSPFIIDIRHYGKEFEGKTIENVKNGQQLIIREIEDDRWEYWHILLISCPLDMNSECLAEWEQKILLDKERLSSADERHFKLLFPTFGPLDPVYQQRHQQHSGSSSEANGKEWGLGTSKALKRNAPNEEEEEEEEESNSGNENKKMRARPN